MNRLNLLLIACVTTVLMTAQLLVAQEASEWQPAQAPLMTRWSAEVDPQSPHSEYPRPQMVREHWQPLNGLWDYAVLPKDAPQPHQFDGRILVPFPIESALSGVMQRVSADQHLWYRRTFQVPAEWAGQRLLLHFGAVDWQATVWVNGQQVGEHQGGYDPFSFEITAALGGEDAEQEIVVRVWDPTDAGPQPRGKQISNPHGIWYTPTTGIWQSVWIEPVPQSYIRSLRMVPHLEQRALEVKVDAGDDGEALVVEAIVQLPDGSLHTPVRGTTREPFHVQIPEEHLRLWSPDDPFLYDLQVRLLATDQAAEAQPLDEVSSYFALRKISLGKDEQGITRILLNDKPLFQYGTLDQGFWPDGLYTAPTDAALRYDIEITKQLGFNMIRKHVKVEPLRWYYWCDKLGLLVWQDMPNGDAHVGPGRGEIERSPESAAIYERELKAIVDTLFNHPSIVMWVPFNEGWGQYQTRRIAAWLKEYDPTRLVDSASGWNDLGVGDVHDIHRYPGPASPPPEPQRAAVLGEFGGLGLPVEGHTWQSRDNWGYRTFETPEALTQAYLRLMSNLRPLIREPGLSAAVYTQTTDVEIEVNGLLTYDRAVLKMPLERLQEAHRKLYLPPPRVVVLVPTSIDEEQTWQYTTEPPAENWQQESFDATSWPTGPGGFGTRQTPGSVVRTEWNTSEIWLRRSFELGSADVQSPHLMIHHDEDAQVFINGVLAAELTGYTTEYQFVPISDAARQALRAGTNVLAVHCKQTGGGQYIDVGLVDLVEQPD